MDKNINQLLVLKCRKCLALSVPPKYNCPHCAGTDFEDVGLHGKGRLLTYTTIRVPPAGFEDQVPYDIGIIELSEGINLTARLEVNDREELKIGRGVTFLRKEGGTYWFCVLKSADRKCNR